VGELANYLEGLYLWEVLEEHYIVNSLSKNLIIAQIEIQKKRKTKKGK